MAIRKQVRHLVKLGADVIKIYIESYEKKEVSKDSLTGAFNYALEELLVLAEEAHRVGACLLRCRRALGH